jgi:hypothetical protein
MPSNLKSFTALGTATLSNVTPQSLTTLFPTFANINNNSFAVVIQAHENNGAGTLIYIGDGTLTVAATQAGFVLKGPLTSNKFENQGAQNSLDFDDFFLLSSVNSEKVRVYVLTE